MKNFKKVIAIILCVVTIIGGFTLMVSAKEEIGGEGWVELVCDTDQKVTFNLLLSIMLLTIVEPFSFSISAFWRLIRSRAALAVI